MGKITSTVLKGEGTLHRIELNYIRRVFVIQGGSADSYLASVGRYFKGVAIL